ncbi:MAG: adenylosuccinate synthetase [Elusimicrobia bacterium]|nr:adenylosuccinate synthetase [Elusimicrobiota bacterium]
MPVDIIVGAQAGDEGKGKICAYLAYKGNYQYAIKVGGPNAGHTQTGPRRRHLHNNRLAFKGNGANPLRRPPYNRPRRRGDHSSADGKGTGRRPHDEEHRQRGHGPGRSRKRAH